jgi:hypothetical protein
MWDIATSKYIWGTAGQLGLAGVGGGSQGPTGPSGSGSIELKPNAGLTNSGPTYATIYNTLVTETTKVPGEIGDQLPASLHPLTWLRGLTAGYFSQKNIVEVLDMILFPTVPAQYDGPSACLSSSPIGGFIEVCNINYTITSLTLNYTQCDAGLASEYSWLCRCNGGLYSEIADCVTSAASAVYGPHTFQRSVPATHQFCGTVSHGAGTICNDSSGNQTPLPACVQANVISTNNSCSWTTIFPYFYGTVSSSETQFTMDSAKIQAVSNREVSCFGSSQTIDFGINAEDLKGVLALPTSLGNQTQVLMKTSKDLQTNTEYKIPGDLWTYSQVYPVNINGVNHTYSLYIFNYPSNNPNNFQITN